MSATFILAVANVVLLRSEKEVVKIHAWRIVATM
jgi:hypothetical protein